MVLPIKKERERPEQGFFSFYHKRRTDDATWRY